MNLLTKIPLSKEADNLIDYNSNILLLGSCFSENIGNKLAYFKFQTHQNPFGILFHPKAVEQFIEDAIKAREYCETDVFYHNERWHCFNAHSKLSDTSKNDLLNRLNTKISSTYKQIQEATHVVITLGTAWVYRFLDTDRIVANCHKIPQKQFEKQLLSIKEIVQALENINVLIRSVNSKVKLIFTVSPVRHLKDGFIENTQSKAHLVTAIHNFLNRESSTGNQQSFYFPSYEIMMDELRDYRFYSEDMVHPNKIAINYIWDCFKSVWVSNNVQDIMDEVDTIQKGLNHIPFNPNSKSHKTFLQKIEDRKKHLNARFPNIQF